jgi:hypothetical protein
MGFKVEKVYLKTDCGPTAPTAKAWISPSKSTLCTVTVRKLGNRTGRYHNIKDKAYEQQELKWRSLLPNLQPPLQR